MGNRGYVEDCVHDWLSYQSRKLFGETCLWMAKLPDDLQPTSRYGHFFYEEVLVDNHTTATNRYLLHLKSVRVHTRFSDLLATYTCDTQTLRRCGGTNRNTTHGKGRPRLFPTLQGKWVISRIHACLQVDSNLGAA